MAAPECYRNRGSPFPDALGTEMRTQSIAYAKFIEMYKAQRPNADMAEIVNNMIAAY